MTKEQLSEGNRVCKNIKDLENECKSIDNYILYITSEIELDDIEIQVHEKWVGTPYVKVNKTNLIGFLNSEKHRIELEIKSLKEKFESL